MAVEFYEGKEEAMPPSRECEECNEVKRCRMYLDRDDQIVYLCINCARELNFLPSTGESAPWGSK